MEKNVLACFAAGVYKLSIGTHDLQVLEGISYVHLEIYNVYHSHLCAQQANLVTS